MLYQDLNDEDDNQKLYNNTTITIDSKDNEDLIVIDCPKLGSGDVRFNTNSDFSKVSMIVNYNWQKLPFNLNWLAIHRSQPIIAYVINPSYTASLLKKTPPEPSEQVLRIINYENRMLGICKGKFASPVADMSFAYNCPSQRDNLVAVMDRGSNINIFSYCEDASSANKSKFDVKLLLEIQANSCQVYDTLALNWCPYVGLEEDLEEESSGEENDSDPGMKLAIASDKSIEVISVDKLISCNSQFKRSELDQDEHDYVTHFDQTASSIIKVFLSSDGNAVCSASKDNSIKFFQFESSELRQMHSWEPTISDFSDNISFFHFLDDYNKLLENYQHEFWGFAFVGTEKGEISIWNLRKWKSSQRLKLKFCDLNSDELNSDEPNAASTFTYKADITSHIITAIKGETVFIIQISFDSLSNQDKSPKIVKITRFQQYNKTLSFVCKRTTEKELDLFWLTPKSLERCTIDIDKLVDENEDKKKNNPLLNIPQDQQPPTNLVSNGLENGLKKTDELSNNDSQSMNPILSFFSTKFKNTFPSAPATNPPSILSKVSSLDQIEKPNTPTSQEVENLFISTSKINPKSNNQAKQEIDLNKILPPQLNKSENSNFYSFSSKAVQKGSDENLSTANMSLSTMDTSVFALNKDKYNQIDSKLIELIELTNDLKKNQEELENEKKLNTCRIDLLEEKLLKEINKNNLKATDALAKVNLEVNSIRKEWKDPNEYKFMHKITESFLKKLMDQLNLTISKGLEEFMGQVKSEVQDLNQQVNKIKTQLDTRLDQCCKKNEKYTKQLTSVMDKLKEITDQQQTFSTELTANLNNLSQRFQPISPSPHRQLNNSLSSVSFSSIYSKEDEERQLKEKIWSLIRTQESSKIFEAVGLALNLKDEQVITKILQHFADKHTNFISIINKDQTILISLLNQLTLHSLEKDIWKIKYLPDIITSLDMNCSIVKNNLPLFINKLIEKLKSIEKIDGISKQEANIPLILFVLNQCKTNL